MQYPAGGQLVERGAPRRAYADRERECHTGEIRCVRFAAGDEDSAHAWLDTATARDREPGCGRASGSVPDKPRIRTNVVVQSANPKAAAPSTTMQAPLRERAVETCTASLSVV